MKKNNSILTNVNIIKLKIFRFLFLFIDNSIIMYWKLDIYSINIYIRVLNLRNWCKMHNSFLSLSNTV